MAKRRKRVESYRRINYSLRPAKNVERKMLSEALSRLSCFESVGNYRYIGFGSTYFSDFILFHKFLRISNMISIERAVWDRERFEFNLPFKCIEIEFGESNDILPSLPWDAKTILWLDYDSQLKDTMLEDISCFYACAVPGSMIIVTVNADTRAEKFKDLLKNLKEQVGEEKVPADVSNEYLKDWGKAKVYRRIIKNEIDQTLTQRNGGLEDDKQIIYKQLFNFHYSDGARMLTVGGLLYEKSQVDIVDKCKFQDLPFVRFNDTHYNIEIPSLTYREIRHLDKHLPSENIETLQVSPIPKEDVKKYARVYRYFPTFAETEI
ncbi:hypothetical protein H8E77_34970 [bacterium]|nr:hypothetical protein [bacterium]